MKYFPQPRVEYSFKGKEQSFGQLREGFKIFFKTKSTAYFYAVDMWYMVHDKLEAQSCQ